MYFVQKEPPLLAQGAAIKCYCGEREEERERERAREREVLNKHSDFQSTFQHMVVVITERVPTEHIKCKLYSHSPSNMRKCHFKVGQTS